MTAPAVSGDVVVNYRAKGVDAVQRASQQVARSSDQGFTRSATAARQVASGLENIARSGNLAGESLKQVTSNLSSIAFGFGTTGAIIGALATLGIAMYDALVKPIQQAQEEARNFAKQLEGLTTLTNAAAEQQRRFSGDPNAVRGSIEGETDIQFLLRSQGIEGLRRRAAALAQIQAPRTGAGGVLAAHGGRQFDAYNAAQAQLREINKLLAVQGPQYAEITKRVDALNIAEGKRAQNAQDAARFLALEKFNQDQTQVLFEANQGSGRGLNLPSSLGGLPGLQRGLPGLTNNEFANAVGSALDPSYVWRNSPAIKEGKLGSVPTPKVDAAVDGLGKEIMDSVQRMAQTVQQGIATTLGDALTAGFDAAFSGKGIGGAITAMTGAALKQLGAMFKAVGEQALLGAKFMVAFQTWFTKNPILAIPAAIGLIALGSALQAGGNAIGGGGSRGANYGYSSAGYSAAPAPIVVGPGAMPSLAGVSPKQAVTVNATIIGPNDPQAGRQLLDLITTAQRRVS